MSVDAIAQIDALQPLEAQGLSATAAGSNFSETMQAEFEAVNGKLVGAEQALRELAAGKQTNLHHVMLQLEDARLSFQLVTQVRNKVLESYQELMRTQI
jgi:flagellar hook-basal body complex protein FliE